MAYVPSYVEEAPTREEIDARPGLALLEFGANWCGHCQAAQPAIAAALAGHPAPSTTRWRMARGVARRNYPRQAVADADLCAMARSASGPSEARLPRSQPPWDRRAVGDARPAGRCSQAAKLAAGDEGFRRLMLPGSRWSSHCSVAQRFTLACRSPCSMAWARLTSMA